MAMLVMATAAFPGRVEAATVDHGLRRESAGEAAHVATVCAVLGVPHETLSVRIDPRGNVSAKARVERYRALLEWRARRKLGWVLTAHHADDQLETVIMRLNRASGVGGLAGIRAKNGDVVRPLLRWRRRELADIVAAAGVAAVADPSNTDDAYDRARLRKALAQVDWLDPVAVAMSAEHLADAEEALDAVAEREFGYLVPVEGGPIEFVVTGKSDEIVRRVALRCIAFIDPKAEVRSDLMARLRALELDQKLSVGSVLVTFVGVPIDNEARWPAYRFERAPPRRSS